MSTTPLSGGNTSQQLYDDRPVLGRPLQPLRSRVSERPDTDWTRERRHHRSSPPHTLSPEHSMATSSSLYRAALLILVSADAAAAQSSSAAERADSTSSELVRRSSVSVSVIQNRPQGAFGQNVGMGYGVDAAYLLRLDDAGIWI